MEEPEMTAITSAALSGRDYSLTGRDAKLAVENGLSAAEWYHTDTIIVGRDPEIAVMRPPDLLRLVLNFFGILDAWHAVVDMARNAAGVISAAEKTFIPEQEQPKAIRAARIWLAIYIATIALALYVH